MAVTSTSGALTSVAGLASGIDTKSIVDALINAERGSTRVVEERRTAAQARLAALQALNTRLKAAQDALEPVRRGDSFSVNQGSSSNDAALGVSATSSAAIGSYNLTVVSVAKAHQLVTGGVASPLPSSSAGNGVGDLVIQVGSGAQTTLSFTNTTSSLDGIASAVNAANLGVSATVINDGGGYRLSLRSQSTGTANAIVKFNGSGALAGLFPTDGGTGNTALREVAAAADAQLRVGDPVSGLLLTRSGNSINDVISGVTLTVKAVGSDIAVNVGRDGGATKTAVKAMVKSLNDAITYYGTNSRFDTTTSQAGVLIAESGLGSQINGVVDALFSNVAGQPAGYANLLSLGVSLDRSTGALVLDEAAFDSKFAADPNAVKTLFASVGAAANTRMGSLTEFTVGAMRFKIDSEQSSIASMTEQITRADANLAVRRQRYEAQFAQMEKIIKNLNSQGSFLNGQIASFQKSSG